LKEFLVGEGVNCAKSQSQIIPVILGENDKALSARDFLMDKGIYAAAIRPPTVPQNTARLRLSLRADLDSDDINLVKHAFRELKKELKL